MGSSDCVGLRCTFLIAWFSFGYGIGCSRDTGHERLFSQPIQIDNANLQISPVSGTPNGTVYAEAQVNLGANGGTTLRDEKAPASAVLGTGDVVTCVLETLFAVPSGGIDHTVTGSCEPGTSFINGSVERTPDPTQKKTFTLLAGSTATFNVKSNATLIVKLVSASGALVATLTVDGSVSGGSTITVATATNGHATITNVKGSVDALSLTTASGATFTGAAVANATCSATTCCLTPQSNCDTYCADVTSDVNNCGACGNACPTPANAVASCNASSCTFACAAPFADCDGDAANGCEANTDSDNSNCGACGVVCLASQTCGGGGVAGICAAPPAKRVFVSSAHYTGNMGGLAGADANCQALAAAAGLQGTFRAWLSDDTTSAASRLTHASVPYTLVDGTVIANDWTQLTTFHTSTPISSFSPSLVHAIDLTEFGLPPMPTPNGNSGCPGILVWTDTYESGDGGPDGCGNWTDARPVSQSHVGGFWGRTDQAYYWSGWCDGAGPGLDCSYAFPIFCFEQ